MPSISGLQSEMADRLLDRLKDCKREFPRAAVLGGAADSVLSKLAGGRAGIREVFYVEQSPAMLGRVARLHQVTGASPCNHHGDGEVCCCIVEGEEGGGGGG